MRSAQLLGRGHLEEGHIACVSEADVAIALSRGGAGKTYRYEEPNEDAVCFAHGSTGSLLAVADGHAGADASELAVGFVLAEAAPHWTEAGVERQHWCETAAALVRRVHTAIVAASARSGSASRTTLSLAWVQPRAGYCGWISVGDSHVFAVADAARELSPSGAPTRFLGSPRHDPDQLGPRSGTCELASLRAIVLATDGLSERGIGVSDPADAAARAAASALRHPPATRPIETARELVTLAIAAQRRQAAGDNVATAVCWLEH